MGEDEPIRSKSRPYSESKLAFVAKVFTLRAKSQSSLEFSPKQLVELPQRIVSSPSLEEFEKTKDITYVVKEPFQYVNLRAEEDGEIVYNSIEPVLTHRDRKSTRLNSSHTVIYTLSLHERSSDLRTLLTLLKSPFNTSI